MSDVACEGEIKDVGIWCLQLVVHAPVDGEAAGSVDAQRRSHGKRSRGDSAHVLVAVSSLGQSIEPGEAVRAVHILNAIRIRFIRGEAEGAVPVEGVDDAFAKVIEVQSIAHTDGTLARASE